MKPVSLQDVVDHMGMQDDQVIVYINKRTGELFPVTEEEAGLIDAPDQDDAFIPDWQKEALPKIREVLASDDFLPLPDQFEVDEYSIMKRFCLGTEDDDLREALLQAIGGSGAFRRFKNMVRRRGIEEDWYRYRDGALKRIAADFLELEGIAYVDDTKF